MLIPPNNKEGYRGEAQPSPLISKGSCLATPDVCQSPRFPLYQPLKTTLFSIFPGRMGAQGLIPNSTSDTEHWLDFGYMVSYQPADSFFIT